MSKSVQSEVKPGPGQKVALVTGAGRGAGKLIAEALAAQGSMVAANDLTPINLDPVVDGINASGGKARSFYHDIAKKVDVQAMVNNIVDDFGHIDVLVNCANVNMPASMLEIDEWDLHRVFEVNAIGTILMMQSVGRVMRTQGSGVIINIVKIPADAHIAYIASRTGLAAMTDQLNRELNPSGVLVFAIADDHPVDEVVRIYQTFCK